ncbi:MAG TPA: hypothetical protein VD864_12300 [Nocardioides sp.]|nr:hypothetical protein [Nocardioides sp.]
MPHEPELTPAEEQVRRLLADARHTEPMPDDVAARLDRVLSGLAGERRDAEIADRSVAVATDLAAARRRRTARNLLIAAAAVVAIGVGLDSADLTVSGGEDSMSSGAADAAGEAEPAAPEAAQGEGGRTEADGDGGPPREQDAAKDGSLVTGAYSAPLARLSEDRFGNQVRRLQREGVRSELRDTAADRVDGLFSLGRALRPGCPTRDWGAGLLVPVRYDGDLGALVFREPSGDTQVVDLFLCGSDEPARSITLPQR